MEAGTFASLVPVHRLARACLCAPAQALSCSDSVGGAPPCLIAWGARRTGSIWAKQSGRRPAAGRSLPSTQVQGTRFFSPWGACTEPWCQPACHRAKGQGARAQLIPPHQELSFLPAASGQKAWSKKVLLTLATECVGPEANHGASFRCSERTKKQNQLRGDPKEA